MLGIRLLDALDHAIRATHQEEGPHENQRDVEVVGERLKEAAAGVPGRSVPVAVVVDPEHAGQHHGERGEADAAGEGEQVVEDGDRFGEDEGYGGEGEGAAAVRC